MTREIEKSGVWLLIVAVVSLLLGTNPGFCDDLSSILKKMRARNEEFQQAIKDMTMLQGTRSIAKGKEMTSETKFFIKGEKFRMELSDQMPEGIGEVKFIYINDGKDFWLISSSMGKYKFPREQAQPIIKEMKKIKKEDWSDKMWEGAKLLGIEKVGKREAYIIKVMPRKSEFLPLSKLYDEYQSDRIWLDKESLVPLKARAKGPEGKTILWIFSDYRKIKGVGDHPYKIEMYEDNKLMSTTITKLLEINKGLSDDLFDPDKVEVKPTPPGTKSQEFAAQADLDAMTTAMEMYYLDCDCYPSGKGKGKKARVGLDALVKNVENKRGWKGPYIKFRRDADGNNIPEDPWGNEYEYEAATSNAQSYTIWCKGNKGDYKAHCIPLEDFKVQFP